jgi:D-alanyl-lipoteichoic acid acyltransferase DltB (MBOAT superfamily)
MALPLGLSFYSLQAISYIVDVYYRKYSCEKNLLYFANFKSFFPQLVAGPIERVNTLLPQIKGDFRASNHDLNVGFFLMIWGFFKKIVIADNLAAVADPVFANPQAFSGHTLAIAVLAFTIQIYCDFSGYTDIATGAARMLGIKLSLNFNNPYFATSITNFWHRWHISLSTWFRDYVYTPIGGNRNGTKRMCIGLIIVFLLSGMWHGANFTFIAWSLIHLISIFVEKVVVSKRKDEQVRFTSWQQLLNWLVTLCIVMLGWIFFRAENIDDGFYIAKSIGLTLLGAVEEASYSGLAQPIMTNLTIGLIAAIFMFAVEYIVNHRIKRASSVLLLRRIGAFAIFGLVLLTLIAGNFGRSSFIYFQF